MTGCENRAASDWHAIALYENAAEIAWSIMIADPIPNAGRCTAPRLRVSLPAGHLAVERTHETERFFLQGG